MKKILKIALIAFAVLIVIGLVASFFDEKKADNVESTQMGTNDSAVTKTNTSKWAYSEEVDKMTSKTTYYAQLDGNNKLDFKFPYDGGSVLDLIIRKKATTDIMLRISKGQFMTNLTGGNLRVRFDQEPAITVGFIEPSDGSTETIFLESVQLILKKLKTSKKMLVEVEFFQEGIRQVEFDVAGFEWSH